MHVRARGVGEGGLGKSRGTADAVNSGEVPTEPRGHSAADLRPSLRGTNGLERSRRAFDGGRVQRPSSPPRSRPPLLARALNATTAALFGAGLLAVTGLPNPALAEIRGANLPASPLSQSIAAPSGAELTFERYHSLPEINAYLRRQAAEHPGLVNFRKLGESAQGREISLIVLSHGDPEDRPAIYFNGTHHGDELATPEAILALAQHLIGHQADPEVAQLLAKYAIYLQPVVNPDGLAANKRKNAENSDPNRGYPYPRQWIRFDAPGEAELVKDLLDEISPKGAVAFHSGDRSVLWPWGYKEETPADPNLARASQAAAEAMGSAFKALQAIQDYRAYGDFADYAYWRHGTIALTFEISDSQNLSDLSELKEIVTTTIQGSMAFMRALDAMPDDPEGNLLTRTLGE